MHTTIIAEIGQNHNGDMGLAKRMISVTKECGADVAKFQLYDVDLIFNKDFEWYKEAKQAQLDHQQVIELKQECDRVGIEFLASIFDTTRLNWILELGIEKIKIASRSIYNKGLMAAAARSGKDMIISLGMYKGKKFPKIDTKGKVDFLYCIAKYPTPLKDLKFSKVDFLKYAGFSDHTIGIEASMVAMARGARIIEKHFTLDKNMHGPDHRCSMDPDELKKIAYFSKLAEEIISAKG
ncbi:MAG: N-acetylneuraminate synthase family protein [Candidatus Omnitrophica bacterium]|nr:N-acetylneuraminate synthase family protein [Candidatus Omnitrophota bacterium]